MDKVGREGAVSIEDVSGLYNVATREYGDMLEMGVIDPAKVTRLALQKAASIASLVLTIDCMVANALMKPSPAGGLPGINPEMY